VGPFVGGERQLLYALDPDANMVGLFQPCRNSPPERRRGSAQLATRVIDQAAEVPHRLRSMPSPTITEAYPAERAAPLAGVPKSTLHYWASNGIWRPSVSPERIRLWSLSDIVMLRVIYWLRRADKRLGPDELPIPRTKMTLVRAAIGKVLAQNGAPANRVFVDAGGDVILGDEHGLAKLNGQQLVVPALDVLSEYRVDADRGIVGPDLLRPRPILRILPGKLAGEPHVKDTRMPTSTLDALVERGYDSAEILHMYSFLSSEAIDQARSLEQQLRRNLSSEAA
jgi:uncharacterized protein (DUF433 family)